MTYTTAHCPSCNAVLVRKNGDENYSKGGWALFNDTIISHPICKCYSQTYSYFINELKVPDCCLVVWKEIVV